VTTSLPLSVRPAYRLQPATGTTCPQCHKAPRLLFSRDTSAPAFYVCRCGFIGEIGVGPVGPVTRVVPREEP
jgi:hypothetical protein